MNRVSQALEWLKGLDVRPCVGCWWWAVPVAAVATPALLLLARVARFWIRYWITSAPYKDVWRHPRLMPGLVDITDTSRGAWDEVIKETQNPKDGSYPKVANWGPYIDGSVQLYVADKDAIAELLPMKAEDIPKNPLFYEYFSLLIGNGLVTSKGEVWAKQRKLLTPFFHFKSIHEAFPVMLESMDHLITKIRASEGSWLPAKETFVRHTSEVIFKIGFGDAFDEDWINNKIKGLNLTFNNYFLGLVLFGPIWNYVPIQSGSGYGKLRREFFAKVTEVVRKKRSKTDVTEEEVSANLLNFLCYSRDEDGHLIPEDLVVDECVTFIFGGQDTTAATLSWTMYFLTMHPVIQKKMQDEVDTILQDQPPTFENLHNLHYCISVIKEAMRLRPVGPILPRMLGKDYTIDGHLIRKGTIVNLFTTALHQDPTIWDKPTEFIPERWEENSPSSEKRKSYTYIPFSAGQRNCIGQKFAMQELIITVAMLFQKFSVIQKGDKEVFPVFEGVLSPKNLELKFLPRTNK
eukprot:TRINITY_DN1150_c0_g1_i1.p1 TRINITY_DN1150_c0_g1~~TRINITY_DN1150_c0_g1_i1.p1  ORF type:complete len:519 (-),score=115.60 TRINITY_DN1150_c0_g1_i1:7-1563(-)